MRTVAVLLSLILVSGCLKDEAHSPTAPDFLDALQLSASPQTIPADGFSRTTITATISADAASSKRTIKFTTTHGSFVAAKEATPTEIEATADGAGIARVELRSSTLVTAVVVTATAAGTVTKSTTINFSPANAAAIVTVTPSTSTAPADGATIVQIVAQIAGSIENRAVMFTTTRGDFAAGGKTATVTAGPDNRAIVDLRTEAAPSTTRITASVAGFTAETSVQFVPARADAISLEAPFTIKADEAPTVTAKLTRSLGTVTAGQVVSFEAFDKDGNHIGAFHNVKLSNAAGDATATFSPEAGTYRDLIRIRATTTAANGQTIVAEATARIVDAAAK